MNAIPKVTHSGELEVRGSKVQVVVLDNAKRVIADSKEAVISNIPTFFSNVMTVSSIKINPSEAEKYKVRYQDVDGQEKLGYNIAIVVDVAESCLQYADLLNAQGIEIPDSDKESVSFSRELMIYLACIGMVSLVDETTGYQEVRKPDNLRGIMTTEHN